MSEREPESAAAPEPRPGACVVVSEEAMASIRRTCYEAGRAGREVYTVRAGRQLVRCADCVNWGSFPAEWPRGYCPVVSRCTRPGDWCCWGDRKGEVDG